MCPLCFLQLLLGFTLAVLATEEQTIKQKKITIYHLPFYIKNDHKAVTDQDDTVYSAFDLDEKSQNDINNYKHKKNEDLIPWTEDGIPGVNDKLPSYEDLAPRSAEHNSEKSETTTEEKIPFTYVFEDWDTEDPSTSMDQATQVSTFKKQVLDK